MTLTVSTFYLTRDNFLVIDDARMAGRKGCILTCKDKLLHYYEKFGFKNCGISQSMHGGAIWYDMRLEFEHE